jgi:four helix bundle protein
MPERDLRVRTKALALGIIKMYTSLPKTEVARVLGRQVLRSGTSVGSNYREAYRARSDAEFLAKMGDCLRELDETAYWLELLVESHTMPAEKLSTLQDETNQITAIFTTIVKKKKG